MNVDLVIEKFKKLLASKTDSDLEALIQENFGESSPIDVFACHDLDSSIVVSKTMSHFESVGITHSSYSAVSTYGESGSYDVKLIHRLNGGSYTSAADSNYLTLAA